MRLYYTVPISYPILQPNCLTSNNN
uniref:Uncharacterized protein n=1 Tax=Anguilla anguilla TaxID=7936 RepID=A0A0E9XA53_ANGAN